MFNIYMPFYPTPRAPLPAITSVHLQISIEPKSSCVGSHTNAVHVIHHPRTPNLLVQNYSPSFPGFILVEENSHHNKPKSFYVGWTRGTLEYDDSQSFIIQYLKRISPTSVELLFSRGTPESWPQKPSWSYDTLLDNSLWARSWMLFTGKTSVRKYYLILKYKCCHNPCSIFS
jgi:hypothetical protein